MDISKYTSEKNEAKKTPATISIDKELFEELRKLREERSINFSGAINIFLWDLVNELKSKEDKTK